jgi:hypothetical protein
MALRRPNKYRNVPVTLDNYRFDSKAEAARYCELKLLERAKEISDLTVHPRFPLEVNGERICIYEADFSFRENGKLIVVDTKGYETDVFKIKAKLFRALHPDLDFRVEASGRVTAAGMQ